MFNESNELKYPPEDEVNQKSYDHKGRLTMSKIQVREGLMTLRYEYPDEDASMPSRIQNLSPDGSLSSVRDFSYNENGEQTSVIETDSLGKLLYSEKRFLDENGRVAARDIVYGGKPEEHIYYKVTRDENGNISEEEVSAL